MSKKKPTKEPLCVYVQYRGEHLVNETEKYKEFLEYLKAKEKIVDGDLVSNCCAWEFDPWGVEKEEGIWQELCLKCKKLCEPLYISDTDIKNIRRLQNDA